MKVAVVNAEDSQLTPTVGTNVFFQTPFICTKYGTKL